METNGNTGNGEYMVPPKIAKACNHQASRLCSMFSIPWGPDMHLQGSDLLTSLLNLQPSGCTTGSNSSRNGKNAIHQRASLCEDTCAFSSMQVIVVYMRIFYCYSLL